MKPSDQDRLLRELFGDESLENLRQASLSGALASLRARRRRRVALTAATAGATLLLALGLVWHGHPTRAPDTTGSKPVPPLAMNGDAARLQPQGAAALTPTETNDAGVKIITDEELFALFPGRSMALIGRPGAQQFVFLDLPRDEAPAW